MITNCVKKHCSSNPFLIIYCFSNTIFIEDIHRYLIISNFSISNFSYFTKSYCITHNMICRVRFSLNILSSYIIFIPSFIIYIRVNIKFGIRSSNKYILTINIVVFKVSSYNSGFRSSIRSACKLGKKFIV